MELAQELIDPWLGTVTPGRRQPTAAPVSHTERLVGVFQSIGSRLTVSADHDGLLIDIEQLEAPAGTPTIQDQVLPADGDGTAQYVHMGARLYRRAPSS
jgi:hypothetical protein